MPHLYNCSIWPRERNKQLPYLKTRRGLGIFVSIHQNPTLFFSSKVKNELLLDLYKCELINGKWILQKIPLNQRMNFVFGCAYQFLSMGDNLLVKVIPENWPTEAPKEPVSVGPSIQVVEKNARKAPGRTYQGKFSA